jgi:hypothetical protein
MPMAAISNAEWRLRVIAVMAKVRKLVDRVWQVTGDPAHWPMVAFIALGICLLGVLGCYWHFWNDLDATTYFYTFSTISQTLAGAFGFLVAVALYRLQSIEQEMERALAEVYPYAAIGDHQAFMAMKNRSHDWDDIEQYIDQKAIDAYLGDHMKSILSTNWNYFKLGKESLSTLTTELVATLRLTSVVISGCLGLMPTSQLLTTAQGRSHNGAFIAMLAMLVVISLACRCLWRYWDIAKHLTDRKPRHHYASV